MSEENQSSQSSSAQSSPRDGEAAPQTVGHTLTADENIRNTFLRNFEAIREAIGEAKAAKNEGNRPRTSPDQNQGEDTEPDDDNGEDDDDDDTEGGKQDIEDEKKQEDGEVEEEEKEEDMIEEKTETEDEDASQATREEKPATPSRYQDMTDEDRDRAYDLKIRMIKRLNQENIKLKKSGSSPRKGVNPRGKTSSPVRMKSGSQTARSDSDNISTLNHVNLVKLVKLYEKQAVKAEAKVQKLEEEIKGAKELANRYHGLYINAKARKKKSAVGSAATGGGAAASAPSTSGGSAAVSAAGGTVKPATSGGPTPAPKEDAMTRSTKSYPSVQHENKSNSDPRHFPHPTRMTDDDLVDDEEMNLFKRFTASHYPAPPSSRGYDYKRLDLTGVQRRSQFTMPILPYSSHMPRDVEQLRSEVANLKVDNNKMIKVAKERKEQMDMLQHNINTSEHARFELLKRLDKEKMERSRLQRTLAKYVTNSIRMRKEQQDMEEARKWNLLLQQNHHAKTKKDTKKVLPRSLPRR